MFREYNYFFIIDNGFAGQIWPVGRTLETPVLRQRKQNMRQPGCWEFIKNTATALR